MKTKTLIFITFIIIVITGISVIYTTVPRLELNGMKNMTISYREKYEEPGVILKNANTKSLNKIKIENNIENEKTGNYYVDYSLKIGAKVLKKRRNVRIIDNIPPSIKLDGEQIIEISLNKEYKEPGFKAYDEYDGDLTNKVEIIGEIDTKKCGEQIIKYRVKDSSNNVTEVNRIVKIIDEIKPVITCNSEYSAFKINSKNIIGCKAIDNFDGDITNKIKIMGKYNEKEKGIYKIEYTVEDDAGNKETISHNIIFFEPKENKKIYIISNNNEQIIEFINKNDIRTTITNIDKSNEEQKNKLEEINQIGLKIEDKKFNNIIDLKEYCNKNEINYIEVNKDIMQQEIEQIIERLNKDKIILIINNDIKKEDLNLIIQLLKEMEFQFELLKDFR